MHFRSGSQDEVFETRARARSSTLMVRSAATPRVSNHAVMDGRFGSSGMTLGELPLRHADGSIDRRGLAGGFVLPGLGGKCADARSRIAETSVDVTHAGR